MRSGYLWAGVNGAITSVITLLYVRAAYSGASDRALKSIPSYGMMSIGIVAVYVAASLLAHYSIVDANMDENAVGLYVGILMGMLLSLVGRFVYGLPTKLFGFSVGNQHLVHFIAVALYVIIVRGVMLRLKPGF